jgi:hypothetical protein
MQRKTTRKKSPLRKKAGPRTKAAKKKSPVRKKATRKYDKKAGRKIERVMEEFKEGKLESGRSGRKVKSRKQAIAIGLREARREGDEVPDKPKRTRRQ